MDIGDTLANGSLTDVQPVIASASKKREERGHVQEVAEVPSRFWCLRDVQEDKGQIN
jgi:hypothetical protein